MLGRRGGGGGGRGALSPLRRRRGRRQSSRRRPALDGAKGCHGGVPTWGEGGKPKLGDARVEGLARLGTRSWEGGGRLRRDRLQCPLPGRVPAKRCVAGRELVEDEPRVERKWLAEELRHGHGTATVGDVGGAIRRSSRHGHSRHRARHGRKLGQTSRRALTVAIVIHISSHAEGRRRVDAVTTRHLPGDCRLHFAAASVFVDKQDENRCRAHAPALGRGKWTTAVSRSPVPASAEH